MTKKRNLQNFCIPDNCDTQIVYAIWAKCRYWQDNTNLTSPVLSAEGIKGFKQSNLELVFKFDLKPI